MFPPELVGAVIAVFLLAVFYEGLKTSRELLLFWDLKRTAPQRRGEKDKNTEQSKGDEAMQNSSVNGDEYQPIVNK